jgi:Raf kinase inhibitor-like YbhB/YbcL family protein
MKLWSDSWFNGDPIPVRCACGRPDPATRVAFGENLNPHLAWDDVPAGTRSFALIAHDFDVPSVTGDVNRTDRLIDEDLPRVDFFHWVVCDLPAGLRSIAEGSFGRGFVPRGKSGPDGPLGCRQGVNDFTGWFAGDVALSGAYFGYDGPFPPFNDPLVHHYVFTLYALDIPRTPVDGVFDGQTLRRAIYPHVLAEATLSGTYTLNPRLLSR